MILALFVTFTNIQNSVRPSSDFHCPVKMLQLPTAGIAVVVGAGVVMGIVVGAETAKL